MNNPISRNIHHLTPSALEGDVEINEEAYIFQTDATRYRKVRILCVLVGLGFFGLAVAAVWIRWPGDWETWFGSIFFILLGAGIFLIGATAPPMVGMHVDNQQIAIIRQHNFGTDKTFHAAQDVHEILIWAMDLGHRRTARREWGVGVRLNSGEIVGLLSGTEERIRDVAEAIWRIFRRPNLPITDCTIPARVT